MASCSRNAVLAVRFSTVLLHLFDCCSIALGGLAPTFPAASLSAPLASIAVITSNLLLSTASRSGV